MKLNENGNCISLINFHYNIPENWDVHKIKHLLETPVTDGPHETPEFIEKGIPFLSVDSIQDGELVFENCRFISVEDHVKFKNKCNPQKNDVFMGKAASIGKIAIVNVDFEFSIWSPLALLRPNLKRILPKFLEYSLKSDYAQDQIDLYATSNTQKNISMDDIPRIQLITPPIEQQTLIINYLNKKTSEIDLTIEKDTRLIELLKEKRTALINHVVTKGLDPTAEMKDSGVEWIGEIPGDWEVRKIKEINDVKISNVDKKSKENEPDVLLCNYTDVYNNEFITSEFEFMKATASFEQIKKLSLQKGDVIITKDSETQNDIAVPALVDEDLENVVCGYHLALIRPNKHEIKGNFLFRLLQSKKINDQFVNAANGVTRFGISTYPIKNSYLIVPPIERQEIISRYLDKESLKLDLTIQKIHENIQLLEEYKKSLIHHVVTGKVDVREVVV